MLILHSSCFILNGALLLDDPAPRAWAGRGEVGIQGSGLLLALQQLRQSSQTSSSFRKVTHTVLPGSPSPAADPRPLAGIAGSFQALFRQLGVEGRSWAISLAGTDGAFSTQRRLSRLGTLDMGKTEAREGQAFI